MKSFRIPLVLSLLLTALPGLAELTKYKEWTKSPEYVYLATDDEKKAWKSVTTDEQAEKFLALFWAKRNPDLKNPANPFKMNFEARVAKADELFKLGSKRGALTERGKLFILVGPPKSMAQKAESSASQPFASSSGGFAGTGGAPTITFQFLYEQPQLPEWAAIQSLDAKFQVDTAAQTEHLIDVGPVKRLENMAPQKALVHPELKEPPVYKTRAEADAEQKAAAEKAAEEAKGPALSEPVRKALEDATAKADGLTLLPLVYGNGVPRLQVQLFVPAAKATAPDAKLGVLVKAKDGKDAARKEEPAALQKTKGDFFVDRVLNVPAGEYDVAVGIFDAAGAPLTVARGSVKVPELPAEFALSPLFLAYDDYEVQNDKPEDPFVFFHRKFVGKAGVKLDAKTDGLSWVVRVYNPTVDATNKINLKKEVWVVKKTGGKIEVPQGEQKPIDVPATKPAEQKAVVLDLAGGVVESNLGQYFAPEDTVKVKITDVASGKFQEVTAPFSIDKAEKPAAPAPAPSKKK